MAKLLTLCRQGEIDRLFRSGRRHRGKHMFVVVAQGPCNEGRVLFPVGRKVGKAVVRNCVRRRLREAYRALRPRLHDGLDIAMVVYPSAAGLSYWDLSAELACLLTRAGALAPAML